MGDTADQDSEYAAPATEDGSSIPADFGHAAEPPQANSHPNPDPISTPTSSAVSAFHETSSVLEDATDIPTGSSGDAANSVTQNSGDSAAGPSTHTLGDDAHPSTHDPTQPLPATTSTPNSIAANPITPTPADPTGEVTKAITKEDAGESSSSAVNRLNACIKQLLQLAETAITPAQGRVPQFRGLGPAECSVARVQSADTVEQMIDGLVIWVDVCQEEGKPGAAVRMMNQVRFLLQKKHVISSVICRSATVCCNRANNAQKLMCCTTSPSFNRWLTQHVWLCMSANLLQF